jgi:hypothetical protein
MTGTSVQHQALDRLWQSFFYDGALLALLRRKQRHPHDIPLDMITCREMTTEVGPSKTAPAAERRVRVWPITSILGLIERAAIEG